MSQAQTVGAGDRRGKRYSVILSDPPWQYRDRATAGKRGAEHKYPVLSVRDLEALRVDQLAAPDCALFMWATMPLLPIALDVMRAWGFRFRTVAFTWVKMTARGTPAMGMGHWTRSNAELVLLGTRGRIKRVDAGVSQVVLSSRGRHSAKPPEVRDRIVQLLGDLPRVELFARERAAGWAAWGLDVGASAPDFSDLRRAA